MPNITVDFLLDESVANITIAATLASSYDGVIIGDFAGTIPAGETWQIAGDVNQTGDVFVEGTLVGIDTFHWQGNGFTMFFQNGGKADLHGKVKARWGDWGTDTTGWNIDDRIGVAATALNVFVPSETLWQGLWSSTQRPVTSPDVTLVDGSVMKPEVVNLSQSIVFENLSRGWHIHSGAGVFNLSDIKFLNCGTVGVLSAYPIHFHQNGESSRGSVLERVIVEGGKNHAFVPHASHGISFPGCAAYNTTGVAFWWDRPSFSGDLAQDSHDINWDDCLAMWCKPSTLQGESLRLAGFWLGRGNNNSCNNSVATCVAGNPTGGSRQRSGFHWPEDGSLAPWSFVFDKAHNNGENGIFTWQNTPIPHTVTDFISYNHGFCDINHGAYSNGYVYERIVASGSPVTIFQHAKTKENLVPGYLLFQDFITDGRMEVPHHNSSSPAATFFTRIDKLTSVVYMETRNGIGENGSYNIFTDCGLIPADFILGGTILPNGDISGINPISIIEVFETGVLLYRWANGVWA